MNERGNMYALAALKSKRAALASEIIELESQLRSRQDSLIHVDATLRLLDPNIDPDEIPNKRIVRHINLFRKGELGRLILGAFRVSDGEPISTAQIVQRIMDEGGHEETARRAIAPRVRGNLAYLERRRKVEKIGEQREARWRLAG